MQPRRLTRDSSYKVGMLAQVPRVDKQGPGLCRFAGGKQTTNMVEPGLFAKSQDRGM